MGTIETKQKTGRVSIPAGELTDRLEREIYLIVEQWKIAHTRYEKDYKQFLRSRKTISRALLSVDRSLKELGPWVTPQADFVIDAFGVVGRVTQFSPLIPFAANTPKIKVKVEPGEVWSLSDPEYREMTLIELYTEYGTKWLSDELDRLLKVGRIPKQMVAACADNLAQLFEKETGRPHWPLVAEIITANFPDILPPDDGRRDTTLWVYNLVNRFRKRKCGGK